MSDIYSMTKDELIVEAEVLNEALMEAEELTNVLSLRLAYLTKYNRLLTERLRTYHIKFDDIDRYMDSTGIKDY